ncbi:MAG: hypothetical protein RL338_1211 [Chloroflexota bacterium]
MSGGVAALAARVVVVLATVAFLVGLAIVPLLNPVWIGFAQARADATGWTGWSDADVSYVTGALLHDLVIGPPAFDVALDGVAVFDERERSHMRDVRGVFAGVLTAAVAGALVLVVARRRLERRSFWRAIRGAGILVGTVVVALGIVFAVAFDLAFEVFHRLLFPPGSYTFDMGSARLVQLLPGRLWYETSLAYGALLVLLATGSVAIATGRLGARRGPEAAGERTVSGQ